MKKKKEQWDSVLQNSREEEAMITIFQKAAAFQ